VSQLSKYVQAMRNGNTDMCIRIEQNFGVFGYPPEIVSVALKAIDEGKCSLGAVSDYLRGEQTPSTT
jgi:hypothetical protein